MVNPITLHLKPQLYTTLYSVLREKIAESAALEMDKLDNVEVAKELAVEKAKAMELEEKLRQCKEDQHRVQEESKTNIDELTRVRLLQTETETKCTTYERRMKEEESKVTAAAVEAEEMKIRLSEMEVELETLGMEGGRSEELSQEVLALKAKHELIESRSHHLQEQVDQKGREMEGLKEELESASKAGARLTEAEEEFHMAVEVLTEERDAARQKEEEYFEELQATSNDLADIQAGYVDLSDRLNDKTDQIFEVTEDLDTERMKVQELRAQLIEMQAQIAEATKALAKAKQEQKNTTAATVTTPSTNPVSPIASESESTTAATTATTDNINNSGSVSVEENSQKDQLIAALSRQVEDLREQMALAPADQVLVDAAGLNAEESSRQVRKRKN